ncbi:Hint domain-containing protein [Seohaeicola saemankumensis]|uniref:Hint domain-containing protein n=1 Tax=Seohaeicola saemankumensis TaxID=481181 RepID=A0ABW3TEH0_9RHOB
METGFEGTFVISWSQTEVDGLEAAPLASLAVGASWSWRGDAVRVDGPGHLLRLGPAEGEAELRKRAARTVRRLVGAAITQTRDLDSVEINTPLEESCFVVTDGAQSFAVTVIEVGTGAPPLLMFLDRLPPRDTDLWIVHHTMNLMHLNAAGPSGSGVICFTHGTRIATPNGPRLVEELCEGDLVQTRDSGPQEVLWVGSRRMSGARLFAMPKLRPIRFRARALGVERPDQDLLVSPDHRMLLRGRAAQALFNTDEVLVAARDLVNGQTIAVDMALREVTYVHLLLPSHHVLWANGLETESFHPAQADLASLAAEDRMRLLAMFPALEYDPHVYGAAARRMLSTSEAAILMHEAA